MGRNDDEMPEDRTIGVPPRGQQDSGRAGAVRCPEAARAAPGSPRPHGSPAGGGTKLPGRPGPRPRLRVDGAESESEDYLVIAPPPLAVQAREGSGGWASLAPAASGSHIGLRLRRVPRTGRHPATGRSGEAAAPGQPGPGGAYPAPEENLNPGGLRGVRGSRDEPGTRKKASPAEAPPGTWRQRRSALDDESAGSSGRSVAVPAGCSGEQESRTPPSLVPIEPACSCPRRLRHRRPLGRLRRARGRWCTMRIVP